MTNFGASYIMHPSENDGRYASSVETVLTRKGPVKRVQLLVSPYVGLPQGAAPSTTLSLLALAEWYESLCKQGIKLMMYADDGFLYKDEYFYPEAPPGFTFAEDKSR